MFGRFRWFFYIASMLQREQNNNNNNKIIKNNHKAITKTSLDLEKQTAMSELLILILLIRIYSRMDCVFSSSSSFSRVTASACVVVAHSQRYIMSRQHTVFVEIFFNWIHSLYNFASKFKLNFSRTDLQLNVHKHIHDAHSIFVSVFFFVKLSNWKLNWYR